MAPFEIPGLIIAIIFASLIIIWQGKKHVPLAFQNLVSFSILTRIVGVIAYSTVVFGIYGGGGDPVIYFRWGQQFAAYFRAFDLSPFFDANTWRGPSFVGTNFVGYPSAFFIMLVGQSFRGTWLMYSLFCLIGLFLFAKVFYRAYGPTEYRNYLYILIIYPSLWFWTASISKDTWMIFGAALFLTGMVDSNKKQNIPIMVFGLFWCYLVRPQLAAMLAFALAGSYFLVTVKKFTFKNIFILIAASAGALFFLSVLGVNDITEAADFAVDQRNKSSYGGSEIQLSSGPLAYIQGPINILFRPFPWQVGGFLQMISFFDIYFIWYMAFKNWSAVKRAISRLRKDRLIAFSCIFIFLFSVGAGLALSNVGLIARQRIILYPFMFLIIYSYSDKRMILLRKKQLKQKEEYLEKLKEMQDA